jgi:hypothetical protein
VTQNPLDRPTGERLHGAERVYIQRSGFVTDGMAKFRQCNGVTGPSMNSRVVKRRDGYVMDKMAAFGQCDGLRGP